MKSTTVRFVTSLLIILLLTPHAVAGPPEPFTTKFFSMLKTIYELGGEDPDQVEIVRYYVYEPDHASVVYGKVAQQDSAFIGVLVAAKAARNQKLPGGGRFDYAACMSPITLFDTAFRKSDAFMKKHAQNPEIQALAQEKNSQARTEAAEKLGEYLPYFREIPSICSFTFNTSFKTEQTIKQEIKGKTTTIRAGYNAFADGRIFDGVKAIVSLGINEESVCGMADQMLAGGFIGRVPVIGNLATSACAGFLGSVIGGVGDAVNAGLGVVNDLGDWIAGQSKHIPQEVYYGQHWAPRVNDGVAHSKATPNTFGPFLDTLWKPCVKYFDSHTMSKKNAQKVCDYHRDQLYSPAVVARLEQEKTIAQNIAEINAKLPGWRKAFVAKWLGKCEDAACQKEIHALSSQAQGQAAAVERDNPLGGWTALQASFPLFDSAAAASIKASTQRENAIRVGMTDKGVSAWSKLYRGAWVRRCVDDLCAKKVHAIINDFVTWTPQFHGNNPDMSLTDVQKAVNSRYLPQVDKAVADSKRRASLAGDSNASAGEVLSLMDCKNFLNRAEHWLCTESVGFAACVEYVKAGKANACIQPQSQRQYATAEFVRSDLEREGCTRFVTGRSVTFRCKSEKARKACERYRAGGTNIVCSDSVQPVGNKQ